jgi:lipid A 3-O-deacylase
MIRAAFFAMLSALIALPAAAEEPSAGGGFIHELKIGAQVHDVPYLWSGFHIEGYAVDLNLEVILGPSIAFLGGAFRPALGATINFYGDTSKAYLDARWQRDFDSGMFLGLGLGVAVHDGSTLFKTYVPDADSKELGRRVLFHPHVEIGYRLDEHRSVSVFFEHISNASTADKNQGLDTLGVRYGYRF